MRNICFFCSETRAALNEVYHLAPRSDWTLLSQLTQEGHNMHSPQVAAARAFTTCPRTSVDTHTRVDRTRLAANYLRSEVLKPFPWTPSVVRRSGPVAVCIPTQCSCMRHTLVRNLLTDKGAVAIAQASAALPSLLMHAWMLSAFCVWCSVFWGLGS